MRQDLGTLLEALAQKVIASTMELTALDSAIGDADHGLNMKRGFEAVLAGRERIVALPLPDALKTVGTDLVMNVGGASGPLYGTLFLTLGKELSADPEPEELARAFTAGVEAVKARGKAAVNNKTMLDVLCPIAQHLASGSATIASVRKLAADCAAATVPMKAIRGRASYLGERSIGHMDPGARSSQIMIEAICDVLEGRQ